MKKPILMLLLLITLRVAAPPAPAAVMVLVSDAVNPYEAGFRATCTVETGNDTLAYNPVEKAHSIAQIREIRLEDYNYRTGSHYTTKDLYDVNITRKIYMYYASKIDYRDPERVAREWNGWRNGMEKESTVEYWRLIQLYLPSCPPKGGVRNVTS